MSRQRQQFSKTVQALALPPAAVDLFDSVYRPVANWIVSTHDRRAAPLVIGINGAQGSGKSTFCALMEPILESAHDLRVVTLSIDDVYRTRDERQKLADAVHPLCAIRGVPGTHDMELANTLIDQLLGTDGTVLIPRFDKATDDRKPPSAWDRVDAPIDIVLFEGWCVGCPELPNWEAPYNHRERTEDPDGKWVRWSAACLDAMYTELFAKLDALIMIAVPSMATVRESRWRQEQRLWELHAKSVRSPSQPAGLMSRDEVIDYVALFERYTEHMLQTLPARAEVLIQRHEAFHYTLERLPIFANTAEPLR